MKDKTINISKELHTKLKLEATKEETSIRELLDKILKSYYKINK